MGITFFDWFLPLHCFYLAILPLQSMGRLKCFLTRNTLISVTKYPPKQDALYMSMDQGPSNVAYVEEQSIQRGGSHRFF